MSNVNGSLGDSSSQLDMMTRSFKELMKIGTPTTDPVLQTNHVGSGDGRPSDVSPNTEVPESAPISGEPTNDDSATQTIQLKDVEDGTSVYLQGRKTTIVANPGAEIDSELPASNKVKVNTITKFDWEHKYYTGSLISVTETYIAYSIKGHTAHSVRVINRHNSSDRVLLKGFTGVVCDVAFSSPCSNTVAAVDSFGNLIVWQINEISGNISAERLIHIEPEQGMVQDATIFRVVWIPCVNFDSKRSSIDESGNSFANKTEDNDMQKLLALSYGHTAEVWDLDNAFLIANSNDKMQRSQLKQVFVAFDDHDADISDCELSPIGNVLATACYDGFVKFWQIGIEDTGPPSCLHSWQPHDGKPVSAVKFVDNKQKSALSVYWRFLLTGCDRNSELKLWCAISWDCLQLIRFAPSTPAHALPELNLMLNLSADYIVLTDINRKVLYLMQMQTGEDETAHVASIAQYHLKSPLLSVAFMQVRPCKFKLVADGVEEVVSSSKNVHASFDDEYEAEFQKLPDETEDAPDTKKLDGVLIKLLAIQSKSLQSLDVRFISGGEFPSEGGPSQDTLSTYNTLSDDIRDTVSLSSVEENLFQASKTDELVSENLPVNGTLSDLVASHSSNLLLSHELKADSPQEKDKDDTLIASQTSPHQQDPYQAASSSVAPDLTRSVSPPHPQQPPVLLTPDAFMAPLKSPNNPAESTNTSFTGVTPYTNREESLFQPSQEILGTLPRNPLSSIVLSPSTVATEPPPPNQPGNNDPTTPPSSPVLPRASSSPERVEVVRSRPVKSPDLISSTSTQDGEANKDASDLSANALPLMSSSSHSGGLNLGFPGAVAGGSGSNAPSAPADVFPPILMQSTSGGGATSWPKAPDVTMSRSMAPRSPPCGAAQDPMPQSSSQENPLPQQADLDEPAQPIEPRPGLDAQELVRILTELQHQQRDLLTDHQRELQTMTKKQSQAQKQNDSSIKRSEQQGDRLEKSLKSVSDTQKRMMNDMKAMQIGVTEATANKISRVIKSEIKQSVLPGLVISLDPFKEQISQSVVRRLTATDAMMRENIANLIKSEEIIEGISTCTAKAVHGLMVSNVTEVMFGTLIPSFERLSQAMYKQLSETYNLGVQELASKMEKQLQLRLKSEQERLHSLIKESYEATSQLQAASKRLSSDITNVLQKQIPAEIEKSVARCEERITSSVLEAVGKQQEQAFAQHAKAVGDVVRDVLASTLDDKLAHVAGDNNGSLAPAASAVGGKLGARSQSRANILDQQQQILKLLQQGNVNTAFQTALTASDLNLVMYVCETVDPLVVFGVTPCPLQQPILLSLIQQLSSDLTTKTEIKWKYLKEAVMNLDRSHQVTQEYMHSVLSALVQKLSTCAQGPLENPSLAKDLKMLSMAAQSLMK